MVPYVVVVVTGAYAGVCVDVSMRRECEGDDNAGVGDRRGVITVSAGHENVGGTRGSGIVSSAVVVLGMSVVRRMRGLGEVFEMSICLARSRFGGEGMIG